jgi:disulfide bond formation protein DsbB
MQEIKILAILSLVYIITFSLITLLNIIKKENYITSTIHSRLSMDTNSVLLYCFILSLVGTLGSLYLSEIKDLEPCKFCWFERILLFPLVIIFLISWIKKDGLGIFISIPFIIMGMILSLYHYSIQLFPSNESCDILNCSSPYIWELGFISIPLMAFFNFFGLLLILFNYKINGEK